MPGTDRYATPGEAEAAFYEAFENRDLEAMMSVWADDGVVCVHPMGPRVEGRAAIASSWRDIFEGGGAMRFELNDVNRIHSETLAVHCVHEDISYGPGFRQRSRVVATNVFRLTDDGWRLTLHHASPLGETDEGDGDDDDEPTFLH